MAETNQFRYVAINAAGRRVRGRVGARDEPTAFELLRRDGLAPLSLKAGGRAAGPAKPSRPPGSRDSAELLGSLADLLEAGADIRTALAILAQRFERPNVRSACQDLSAHIAGGEALDRAFGRVFMGPLGFVASMVAAGEAAGDLPGGLRRSAEIIAARLKLRDQLVSVLAYPLFVLASAIVAVLVILLFIIPSVAPLAEQAGGSPPTSLAVMIWASHALRSNLASIGIAFGMSAAATLAAATAGALHKPLERLLLDGPFRRTVRGLLFGGFAISLGAMLTAGAPASDALRLAIRTAASAGARRRLEPVIGLVRQGESISRALEQVPGFPPAVLRLAAVGEASNGLGPMLARGGRLEEEAALRRIEAMGRLAGPLLIVVLGAFLGVLMGGLLSGVSGLGQSVLG